MWEQYRKTLWGMQLVIAMITFIVYRGMHHWVPSLVFFTTMQIAAVVGAMWATRLRRLFARPSR
jgi:hypothetical protein